MSKDKDEQPEGLAFDADAAVEIVPVILAGGKGMRLRPLTRKKPKPFLNVGSAHSLLQETALRCSGWSKGPVVVCDSAWADVAAEELRDIGFAPRIVAEPLARSTAPAIALAAFTLIERQDVAMLVMPSDHYIADKAVFAQAVREMRSVLESGDADIVMLGVRPDAPHRRYGYICADDMGRVQGFIEKPDTATARRLMAWEGGKALWNTGVFLVRPAVFLEILQMVQPIMHKAVEAAYWAGTWGGYVLKANGAAYSGAQSLPVDYAVMERLIDGGYSASVVELRGVWHDVGSWRSFLRVALERRKGRG